MENNKSMNEILRKMVGELGDGIDALALIVRKIDAYFGENRIVAPASNKLLSDIRDLAILSLNRMEVESYWVGGEEDAELYFINVAQRAAEILER